MLTSTDRKFLKGLIDKNSRKTTDFSIDLEKKIYALLDDLQLIRDDPVGNALPVKSKFVFELRKPEYSIATSSIYDIVVANISRISYLDQFQIHMKKKVPYYWLKIITDNSEVFKKNTRYVTYKNSLRPNFMFRRLHQKKNDEDWLNNSGKILIEAFTKNKNLIPTNKEDAVSISYLKEMISNKKKYKKWNKERIKEDENMTLSQFKEKFPKEYSEVGPDLEYEKFVKDEWKQVSNRALKFMQNEIKKLNSISKKRFNRPFDLR